MSEPVRVFVVGCPRSGTTLLQSMLAAHPAVLAFPETHALWGLQSARAVPRRLGLRRPDAAATWSGLPALGVPVTGPAPRTVGRYVRGVAAALDAASATADRTAWSEKTPGHLRALHLVDRYVPAAHVVHVVRQGVPTVTSLYAVTQDHGEAWDGERSVDLCLTRWRNDLRRTAARVGRPRDHVVSYEALVSAPESVLAALVGVLGLPGDPAEGAQGMAAGYAGEAGRLSSPGESWKEGVGQGLRDRATAHDGVLDEAELARVRAGVAEVADLYARLPFVGAG